MKLLLDQNLSYKLCDAFGALFRGTAHVRQCGLIDADDIVIWTYARDNGFVVVTKDRDFVETAIRQGPPPKLIWIRCGNRPTEYIENLVLGFVPKPIAFERDPDSDYIELA